MARKKNKDDRDKRAPSSRTHTDRPERAVRWHDYFTRFAHRTAAIAGSPAAFLMALAVVLFWAACGYVFGFSDTWQLVINTGTTIVTFLMVFLIQSTQNRDSMAVQIKLAELIMKSHGARNTLATAEELSDEDLERIHHEYCAQADATLEHLNRRRAHRADS